MRLKDRLRRLQQEAEKGGVLIRQRDGTVRVFDVMRIHTEMLLAQCYLLRGTARDSEVLDAVRRATPESRRAFEECYGPITMSARILGVDGSVETYTLTESGQVEKVRHEGGSEEAERIWQNARQ